MTRPKRKRTEYSVDQKAAALATLAPEGGNVKKTSRIVGVSPSTLRGWRAHPMPVLQRWGTERKTGVKRAEVITVQLVRDERGWLRLAS